MSGLRIGAVDQGALPAGVVSIPFTASQAQIAVMRAEVARLKPK